MLGLPTPDSSPHEGARSLPDRPREAHEGVAPLHHQGAAPGRQLLFPHCGQARPRTPNGLHPRAPSLARSLQRTSRMRFVTPTSQNMFLTQRRRVAEYAEAVRGGFALRTDFIVTHKQGIISGGQPPDPRCGVPCRAAAIKLSAYSAPQRLCVKNQKALYD